MATCRGQRTGLAGAEGAGRGQHRACPSPSDGPAALPAQPAALKMAQLPLQLKT